jgi:L,D-transpeptidase ErfK/SrfK
MRIAAAAVLAVAALMRTAAAEVFELGETYHVRAGETLLDVARAHSLGYVQLMAANRGVDPWLPPEGATVILPTTHIAPAGLATGLTVNLGDMRLYFSHAGKVDSYAVGIGREGWELQPAQTRVAGKRRNPEWRPPASIRAEKPWLPDVVPPGPGNPLGEYSLDLALDQIRIHGTNLPDGVGRRTSHGCLRLYPEDIARLFPEVPVGTPVRVIFEPAKLAWIDNALWLEIHPTGDQADAIEDRQTPPVRPLPGLRGMVLAAAGAWAAAIDWPVVEWAETTRPAIPVRITAPGARLDSQR